MKTSHITILLNSKELKVK